MIDYIEKSKLIKKLEKIESDFAEKVDSEEFAHKLVTMATLDMRYPRCSWQDLTKIPCLKGCHVAELIDSFDKTYPYKCFKCNQSFTAKQMSVFRKHKFSFRKCVFLLYLFLRYPDTPLLLTISVYNISRKAFKFFKKLAIQYGKYYKPYLLEEENHKVFRKRSAMKTTEAKKDYISKIFYQEILNSGYHELRVRVMTEKVSQKNIYVWHYAKGKNDLILMALERGYDYSLLPFKLTIESYSLMDDFIQKASPAWKVFFRNKENRLKAVNALLLSPGLRKDPFLVEPGEVLLTGDNVK